MADVTGTVGINIHHVLVKDKIENLGKVCDRFSDMGFDCVELPVDDLGIISENKITRKNSKAIVQTLSSYNFRRTLHSSLNLLHPPHSDTELWKGIVEFAHSIEVETIVVHGGEIGIPTGQETRNSSCIDRLSEVFYRLSTFAQNAGINLSIENADPRINAVRFGEKISDLVDIVEKLKVENIGIALDTGHLYLAAKIHGFDILRAVREAVPHLNHVHLDDNLGRTDGLGNRDWGTGMGDLHLPIGWGSVPIAEIMKILQSSFFGIYLLDLHPRFVDHYPESLEKIRRYLSSD